MKITNHKLQLTNKSQNPNNKNLKKFEIFKNQIGATLVELIVYMAMFSVLLIMLLQMFTSILNAQLESQSTSSVAMDGRFILARLSYDIKNASNIVVPSLFGSSGSGNTLRITGPGTDFTYSLSSGNIILTDNTTGYSGMLNSVDTTIANLTFTKIGSSSGGRSVDISMTLNSKIRRQTGIETKTFVTAVGTR